MTMTGECRMVHSHENLPSESGLIPSSRLWPTIITIPNAPIHRTGRRTRAAINTMDMPNDQMTSANAYGVEKVQANPTTVDSRNTSHRPRVQKNRETSCTDLPRETARYAPVPANSANVGAQKWVMKRVRNRTPFVRDKSSGWKVALVK